MIWYDLEPRTQRGQRRISTNLALSRYGLFWLSKTATNKLNVNLLECSMHNVNLSAYNNVICLGFRFFFHWLVCMLTCSSVWTFPKLISESPRWHSSNDIISYKRNHYYFVLNVNTFAENNSLMDSPIHLKSLITYLRTIEIESESIVLLEIFQCTVFTIKSNWSTPRLPHSHASIDPFNIVASVFGQICQYLI